MQRRFSPNGKIELRPFAAKIEFEIKNPFSRIVTNNDLYEAVASGVSLEGVRQRMPMAASLSIEDYEEILMRVMSERIGQNIEKSLIEDIRVTSTEAKLASGLLNVEVRVDLPVERFKIKMPKVEE